MGNVAGKLTPCLCPAGAAGVAATADISRRHDIAVFLNNPLTDDGLGHSFCYIKPDSDPNPTPNPNPNPTPTSNFFSTISGASLSANASTALSTTLLLDASLQFTMERASSFSSSPCFASVPLQPIPRDAGFISSGPIPTVRHSGSVTGSGPIERGFLSGPIERGLMSGPMVGTGTGSKLEKMIKAKYKVNKWGSVKGIKDSILNVFWGGEKGSFGKRYDFVNGESVGKSSGGGGSVDCSSQITSSLCEEEEEEENEVKNDDHKGSYDLEYEKVEWAEGKAGEDRVHIVVSEDHGWVFVGIYDGFNGPDAPDFLLSNLYSALHKELTGLCLWNNNESELGSVGLGTSNQSTISKESESSWCVEGEIYGNGEELKGKQRSESQIMELDEKVREKLKEMGMKNSYWSRKVVRQQHSDVLKALSDALRKTEEAYLDIADKMVKENPELSLMGSCVLAMLMIGEDVYLMNVGDSRAVLAQKSAAVVDLHHDHTSFDDNFPCLTPLQLTFDHNTYVKEEVQRIRKEHPDDPCAVVNDRVKGSLKVTRAFGAGFLKQRKWNDALLEMFRIKYVGSSPYLTTTPSLFHHKLGPNDKFLILSSDGLYQYMTNEEAVSEVEFFMAATPEGDPAQHLIEQVLFRAAKKCGMDFYELLDIPQGERRRYHDDVSIIVISLEGTIWRSSHLNYM